MHTQELGLKFDPNDQITGFSYSFTKILTVFLEGHIKNETLCEDQFDDKYIRDYPDRHTSFRPEVNSAISYLTEQLNAGYTVSSLEEICKLVQHSRKFLEIFETPEASKLDLDKHRMTEGWTPER
jgi:hypothetical protein